MVDVFMIEVKEGESFTVECVPSDESVKIVWFIELSNKSLEYRNQPLTPTNYPAYTFSPPLLQHRYIN